MINITEIVIRKYPKIPHLGEPYLANLFENEVEVSEKIDGSQFRAYFDRNLTMEFGTKETQGMERLKTEQLFSYGVNWLTVIKDRVFNWLRLHQEQYIILFCETLYRNKHNTIQYGRIPKNHLYLFGAMTSSRNLDTGELIELAKELDIEPLNVMFVGKINERKELEHLLKSYSVLSGNLKVVVEGIVIKNYKQDWPIDLMSTRSYYGFPLMGKWVNERFVEENKLNWKQMKLPIEVQLKEIYMTDNRLLHTIQHLKESGKISGK